MKIVSGRASVVLAALLAAAVTGVFPLVASRRHEALPTAPPANAVALPSAKQAAPAAESGAEARTIRVLGHVQPKPELVAQVTAPIWGRVVFGAKPLAVGQPVRKGEALLQLVLELSADERYLMEARKVEIRAAAAIAQARYEEVERTYTRAVALLKAEPGNRFRRQQVQAAERVYKAAKEEVSLLQRQEKAFEMVMQRRDPRITTVEAPISGVITEVATKPGERNPTGTFRKLCTIADLSRVWIEADVFETDVGDVLDGARASFSAHDIADPRPLGAPVAVLPWLDEQARTLKVIFEVPNPDRRLRLGMTVDVFFDVPASERTR